MKRKNRSALKYFHSLQSRMKRCLSLSYQISSSNFPLISFTGEFFIFDLCLFINYDQVWYFIWIVFNFGVLIKFFSSLFSLAFSSARPQVQLGTNFESIRSLIGQIYFDFFRFCRIQGLSFALWMNILLFLIGGVSTLL